MDKIRIIEAKESLLADNDKDADVLRSEMKVQNTFYVNVMSSPGSGKTTPLRAPIGRRRQQFRIGVMEADIDSDVDAKAIAAMGIPTIQIHTGGMCHLDADMSRQGLRALGAEAQDDGLRKLNGSTAAPSDSEPLSDSRALSGNGVPSDRQAPSDDAASGTDHGLDLVFLENVGNLVCPAEFDTGADMNVVILSVPEGDDKPLKYPLMFEKADVVLINKCDAMEVFDFDREKAVRNIHLRHEACPVFFISAASGEGLDEWCGYLAQKVTEYAG